MDNDNEKVLQGIAMQSNCNDSIFTPQYNANTACNENPAMEQTRHNIMV